MVWLLTNDDGIDAPGIQALHQGLQSLSAGTEPTVIVAPAGPQSGCGHQVTTTVPIQVQPRRENAYAIVGTPADCVRLGLSQLCSQVDLVLSGINAGANLGVDAYISGTVAAVREAAFHRIPGIAISQYRQGKRPIDWEVASRWTTLVLNKLLTQPPEPGSFWNVNFPHLLPDAPDPEIVFCQPSTLPLPLAYRLENGAYQYVGNYSERPRSTNCDVNICFGGAIAVTQVRL
jgi:5'-nucleotidase